MFFSSVSGRESLHTKGPLLSVIFLMPFLGGVCYGHFISNYFRDFSQQLSLKKISTNFYKNFSDHSTMHCMFSSTSKGPYLALAAASPW